MTDVLAVGPKTLTRHAAVSLQDLGSLTVTTCSSSRALARQLRARPFHLAIVDWQTCGREGMALLSHLRIPVILISQPEHLAEAYRLAKSVEVVLERPVNRQELRSLAAALARREKAPQQTRPEAPQAKPATIAKGAGG